MKKSPMEMVVSVSLLVIMSLGGLELVSDYTWGFNIRYFIIGILWLAACFGLFWDAVNNVEPFPTSLKSMAQLGLYLIGCTVSIVLAAFFFVFSVSP